MLLLPGNVDKISRNVYVQVSDCQKLRSSVMNSEVKFALHRARGRRAARGDCRHCRRPPEGARRSLRVSCVIVAGGAGRGGVVDAIAGGGGGGGVVAIGIACCCCCWWLCCRCCCPCGRCYLCAYYQERIMTPFSVQHMCACEKVCVYACAGGSVWPRA